MKKELNSGQAEPATVVIVEAIQCHSCGHAQNEPKVVLKSMESHNDGWKASGTVECPNCGVALKVVRKRIPIEAANFKCPTCDSKTSLKYKIKKIEQADRSKAREFEFEVEIVCEKLSHKFSYKKIIKSILNVMSIGVGPEGVKISKSE